MLEMRMAGTVDISWAKHQGAAHEKSGRLLLRLALLWGVLCGQVPGPLYIRSARETSFSSSFFLSWRNVSAPVEQSIRTRSNGRAILRISFAFIILPFLFVFLCFAFCVVSSFSPTCGQWAVVQPCGRSMVCSRQCCSLRSEGLFRWSRACATTTAGSGRTAL